jgi:type II secretion system protein G
MNAETKSTGSMFPILLGLCLLLAAAASIFFLFRPYAARRNAIALAKADLMALRSALAVFEVDNSGFPTTSQGLSALTRTPTQAPLPKDRRGPYLVRTQVPLDPWSNPYVYRCPGLSHPGGYDLFSCGPDGQPGTRDDIEY